MKKTLKGWTEIAKALEVPESKLFRFSLRTIG